MNSLEKLRVTKQTLREMLEDPENSDKDNECIKHVMLLLYAELGGSDVQSKGDEQIITEGVDTTEQGEGGF